MKRGDAIDQEYLRITDSTIEHDMYAHPDEHYFRNCYLYWIFRTIDKFLSVEEEAHPLLLDIGCGQGRLTIPTAKKFDRIISTGVDLSEPAIMQARENSRTEGVENRCFFENCEALKWTKNLGSETQNVIFLNEVVFYAHDYLSLIEEAFRILKPGGIAFISFRSRYFNLAHVVKNKTFDKITQVLESNQGELFGKGLTFSWHDQSESTQLLSQYGFEVMDNLGIGIFSGLPGDPMADWCSPSSLDSDQRKKLFELETNVAREYANSARYILSIVTKTNS